MIKIIKYPKKKLWNKLAQRPVLETTGLETAVEKMISKVKKQGDKAVCRYTKKFDHVKLKTLVVSKKEIEAGQKLLSMELITAIQQAKQNIEKFHQAQVDEVKYIETMPGIKCWRKSAGIEKVGIYIPGGTAPLFSTVLMLAIPAAIAGCKEIVLCTPPSKDGTVHPAILFAADLCGIKLIFKAGGVQAIAAMAYGTESIPGVFKIFGPGNQYVNCAKQFVQKDGVAIDMPAGPSEVIIIADESAVPEFIAADLLSQAEHGTDSQVILLTYSEILAKKVKNCIAEQIKELPRKAMAEKTLLNSKIILLNNPCDAIEFSNLYAPEHLILACNNAEEISSEVIAAGSVFLGNYSPESAGDYASGTNHTLPTNGYAAIYSGVSVDSFVKKITFQQLTKEGLKNIGNTVMLMADAEGLAAHKQSIALR
ncbi:MAG TPA: histidinol dehydrogenase, partial [Chitinophagaceae bacterium]|nr:histidinol dehydrogenase [Chitinophagaceae bacterium]